MKSRFMFAIVYGFMLLLSGCATFTFQFMSRADGKIYVGSMKKTGDGQATIQVDIQGQIYKGNLSRITSEQYMSYVGTFATDGLGNRASASSMGYGMGANASFMALLSNQNGDGMRCALQGDRMSGTGGGYCMDAKNNIYDVMYNLSGGVF